MRKKQTILLSFAALFSSFLTQKIYSQTVDEIIEKHTAAMGGKEKLDSLRTLVFEGTYRLEQFELPLKAYIANNTGQRYNLMVLKIPGFLIATPAAGWQFFPFQGMTTPKQIKQEELDPYLSYMDLQGPLYNYREKGNTIEYLGLENTEEKTCYKLSVQLKTGMQMTSYIDTTTNYLIKTLIKTIVGEKTILLENHFSNFQTTAEGYVFPFALTIGPVNAYISKIFVNQTIDPILFDPVTSKDVKF